MLGWRGGYVLYFECTYRERFCVCTGWTCASYMYVSITGWVVLLMDVLGCMWWSSSPSEGASFHDDDLYTLISSSPHQSSSADSEWTPGGVSNNSPSSFNLTTFSAFEIWWKAIFYLSLHVYPLFYPFIHSPKLYTCMSCLYPLILSV